MDMINKQVTNSTSFQTLNYESTWSTKKPKEVHPQRDMYKTSFNIVTNNEGAKGGINVPAGTYQSVSHAGVEDSARGKHEIRNKAIANHSVKEVKERPSELRPQIVETYIKSVMEQGNSKNTAQWIKVIEQIYRLNLDNRILNNLRQQLNEMIEDEKGLV